MNRLTETEQELVGRVAGVTRIIILALITGVVAFAGCAWVVRHGKPAAAPGLLTTVLAVLSGGLAVVSFQLPVVIAKQAATSQSSAASDISQQASLYQTCQIIAGALLEGGAFMNLVAYIVEGSWTSLLVAGALLLLLVRLIPTQAAAVRWVEWRQQEQY